VISGRIVNECCIAPGYALACIGNIGRVHAGADRRGGSILAVPLLHHRYTGVAASRTAQRRVKAAFFGYRCRYRFNHCWQGDGSNNGHADRSYRKDDDTIPAAKNPTAPSTRIQVILQLDP